METNYDVDYFIRKFEAIPEEKFIANSLTDMNGGYCVNGWCGVTNCVVPTKESAALKSIIENLKVRWFDHGDTPIDKSWDYHGYSLMAVYINNGWTEEYQQPTPKQRILAALYDIKKMQQPKHTDITASLAVLPVDETSDLIQQLKTV